MVRDMAQGCREYPRATPVWQNSSIWACAAEQVSEIAQPRAQGRNGAAVGLPNP
jgi:hypothetical protein